MLPVMEVAKYIFTEEMHGMQPVMEVAKYIFTEEMHGMQPVKSNPCSPLPVFPLKLDMFQPCVLPFMVLNVIVS